MTQEHILRILRFDESDKVSHLMHHLMNHLMHHSCKALLFFVVAACSSVASKPASQMCGGLERTATDRLSYEFKAMTFDVKTDVKEFTIAGEVQQIKRVQLAEPEKALSMLTALAQKHVEFKMIRMLMPGTVVSMEYREDRINFQFDESGLPVSVRCG